MALPNIEKLTSQLAMLPDAALRQMAQMHKSDPYVLPLIISEDGRRKQMRAASQAQAGAQPQPKVADAAVQQIGQLPEQVGIGALSAPSMAGMPMGGITGEEQQASQGMAGGGMIAFAHGGDVERYQVGGQPPITGSRFLESIFGAPPETSVVKERRERLEAAAQADALERATARGETLAQERARNMAAVAAAASPTDPSFRRVSDSTMALPSAAEQLRLSAAGQEIPAVAAPAAVAEQRRAPEPSGARPTAAGAPSGGLGDLNAMYSAALTAAGAAPNQFAAAQKEVGEEKVRAKEEAAKGIETIQKQYSDIFKGRKERLDTREAELGKMKDQGLGLALLQAGAAMMSTPGGLGVALGKGVKVGTEQYAAGVDKLRSAQEKIADARDRLEEVEAQRGELSARELFKARNEVKDAQIGAKEDMIKSNMQMYGVNRETAMKMLDNQVRVGMGREEIAGRERAARISAGTPGQQMQMAAALGGGSSPAQLAAGLQKMAEATTGKTDMRTLYASYLSGVQKNPTAEALSYSQFVGQFAIPTSPSNNAAAAVPGTVRERP